MMLEAVWSKNGKEIYKVSPVMCIVCDEDMKGIPEIEILDDIGSWHSCEDADGFVIRVKND